MLIEEGRIKAAFNSGVFVLKLCGDVRLTLTKIGPNILENISSRPYKTVLDQNNILEDELFGPLISVPNNCLPGCWARENKKEDNFSDILLANGPVWKHGRPVQCCVCCGGGVAAAMLTGHWTPPFL